MRETFSASRQVVAPCSPHQPRTQRTANVGRSLLTSLRFARERSLFARQSLEEARPRSVFERPVYGTPSLLRGQQAQRKAAISRTLRTAGEALLAGFRSSCLPCVKVARPWLSQLLRARSQRGVRNLDRTFPAGFLPTRSPAAVSTRCHILNAVGRPRFGWALARRSPPSRP